MKHLFHQYVIRNRNVGHTDSVQNHEQNEQQRKDYPENIKKVIQSEMLEVCLINIHQNEDLIM